MTARSSRTESHWACSKCGRDVGAYKKCPHCGGAPRQVVVQEERTISWTGSMHPKVLRAALSIEPTRALNRPALTPARPEMGVKSKPTTKGSTNPGDVDVRYCRRWPRNWTRCEKTRAPGRDNGTRKLALSTT